MTEEDKLKFQIIKAVLEIEINADQPHSMIDKLIQIDQNSSKISELLASTERDYNIKFAEVNKLYSSKTPTERKIIFGESGAEEIYNKTLAEEYSNRLSKQIDILRTLVSYSKKDFETFNYNR